MNREELGRTVEAAGGVYDEHVFFSADALERFVELIAAAEREACAKLCEDLVACDDRGLLNHNLLMDAAVAIRARA